MCLPFVQVWNIVGRHSDRIRDELSCGGSKASEGVILGLGGILESWSRTRGDAIVSLNH